MNHRLKLFLFSFGIVLLILFTLAGFSSKRNSQTTSGSAVPTEKVQQSISLSPSGIPVTVFPTNTNVSTPTPSVSSNSNKPLEKGYCSNEKRGGLWICPDGYFCDNIPVKFDCVQGAPCANQYNGTCRLTRPD